MSSVIPARRRAERFHALVEGSTPPGADAAAYAELLALVGELRESEPPTPSPTFVAGLRDALMSEADTVLLHLERDLTLPTNRSPGRRRPQRRLAVALGALTFVGATVSMSVAAQSALPGEALYPVKRALENAQTGLSSGEGKTEAILGHAVERLDEVDRLARDGSAEDDTQVPSTLHDFTEQARVGAARALRSGDEGQLTALRDFTAAGLPRLTALEPVVPDQARDELATAAQVLAALDQQALAACPTCGGAPLNLPPVFLSAAPGPAGALPDAPLPTTPGGGAPSAQPSSGPSVAPPGATPPAVPGRGSTNGPLPIDPTGSGPLADLTDALLPSGSVSVRSDPVGPILSPLVSPLVSPLDDALGGLLGG